MAYQSINKRRGESTGDWLIRLCEDRLLPEHHYEADREWINKMLGYLQFDPIDDSKNDRGKVCRAYSKAYSEAVSLEPIQHKKTNAARYEANTRLRKFIEKRFRVFNK